jgi:hypothetical protein
LATTTNSSWTLSLACVHISAQIRTRSPPTIRGAIDWNTRLPMSVCSFGRSASMVPFVEPLVAILV